MHSSFSFFGHFLVLLLRIHIRPAFITISIRSIQSGGKKRRPARTALSSPRNKSWRRKKKKQQQPSCLGGLHLVLRRLQFSPGCTSTSVLIHLLEVIERKAAPPEINAEQPDAWQAVCGIMLLQTGCAHLETRRTEWHCKRGGKKHKLARSSATRLVCE